jgi:hypothetical protein
MIPITGTTSHSSPPKSFLAVLTGLQSPLAAIRFRLVFSRICHRHETSRSDFRWDWVVKKARRPLESANPHDLGQDLHVPVKVLFDGVPIPCSRAQKWPVLEG